ncbi:hypothetical protein L7F22_055480 [Adiantum nelumboides]|nr:hypothetical protein [Adiantum nelumboides]
MAPPRRGPSSSSSSKRPQQHTQSTQSGIHRFFSAHNARIAPSTPAVEPLTQSVTPPQGNISKRLECGESRQQRKLQRISPGMLIQPSQDDGGGDQVVWNFSPITNRLQEASAADMGQHPPLLPNKEKPCTLPNMQQLFQKSPTTEINGPMRTRKKRSPNLAGKLEQWLSTSSNMQENGGGTAKATSKRDTLCVEHQTPAAWDKENVMTNNLSSGLGPDINSQKSSQGQGHSVRRPLRRHSLVGKVQRRKNNKQRGLGQRRKALLELLDQVQNVMSDPESVSSHAEGDAAGLEDFNILKSFAPCKQKDHTKVFSGTEIKHINNASKQNSACLVTSKDKESIFLRDLCMRALTDCAPSLSEATPKDVVKCNNDVDALFLQLDQTDNLSAIPEALASIHFLVLEVADVVDRDGQNSLPKKVLRLLNEYSGSEQILYLGDEWYFTVVRPGDTINVIGEFDSDGKCVIDRNNNLLIVHPDILISGSKVGTSFSCPRRAVLDERIRPSSVAFPALLGTMMHELFQVGLRDRVTSRLPLEQEAKVVVHRYIDSLYACGGNEKDALIKLTDSIPTILKWLDCFLFVTSSAFPKVDFGTRDGQLSLSISEVTDIEEMIYSPKFGLKGMIDASLLVKLENLTLASKEKILPLEFKTGKQTSGQAALEHRAQVILYSLLMSDRYRESVDSGLLFYLQTNQTQGVTTQRGDLLGLVMRRNEHATNMLSASSTQQLPPMLQSMHLCQRCWHVDVCSIYHKALEGGTAESSGLGEVFNQTTEHLNVSHIEFLKSWDRLIDLEAQELQASQREIWRLPSQERERSGRCLSMMKLIHHLEESPLDKKNAGPFLYSFSRDLSYTTSSRFKREMSEALGLHERSFTCGDHVVSLLTDFSFIHELKRAVLIYR